MSTHSLMELTQEEIAQYNQAIVDNVADGIISIDKDGRIQSANRAAIRIFGYELHELVGNNVSMLMPLPWRDQHDGFLKHYQETGQANVIGIGREVEGMRKNGELFPLVLNVSQVIVKGQTIFVGLLRDNSALLRMERLKHEFVSVVSHELRTPLTSISGPLGLILGGVFGELPPQIISMLSIAHKNSLRLAHLIDDLLDLEKLATGKFRFHMEVQPLMPLVQQALEATAAYAEKLDVCFLLTRQVAPGLMVEVDADRLQQVLANFLSNAAKYSPPGKAVNICVQLQDDQVKVEVCDQGPGIPEEFYSRIFQKFSQADSIDAKKKGGTGLGLAISKDLIEGMGGRVGFSSEPAQGSCFNFLLPIVVRE